MSDKDNKKLEKLTLKVDAHVVRQLGEELITDPEQAILELIKNSYDADADWCRIEIDNHHIEEIIDDITDGENKKFISKKILKGKITIKDNGIGMSREQISDGWLVVSHSSKRALKSEGKQTKKKRNYTGDKGLGRLGSMKLADFIRISTHNVIGKDGISVSFNWNDFIAGRTIDTVSVTEDTLPKKNDTGTTIELLGIKKIDYWTGQQNHTLLQAKLSSLLSPFGHLSNFKTYLVIDGIEISINKFEDELKNQSIAKFSFELKNKKIISNGYIKLNFYKGNKTENKSDFKKFILPDKGHQFFETLKNKKNLSEYSISILKNDPFEIKISSEINWEDITSSKEIKYPGDLNSEMYYYFLNEALDFNDLSTNDSKSLIKSLIGVSAFRDGFRVSDGGNKDWLNFSEAKRSGEGFYSIRSANSIGYIALSADRNPEIIEKSDREGFIENPAYNGLMASTDKMLEFINGFLNRSRRAANDLMKNKREIELNKPENYSAEDAIVEIQALTKKVIKSKKTLHDKSQKAATAIKMAHSKANAALNDLMLDEKSRNEIENLKAQISRASDEVKNYEQAANYILDHIEKHEYSAEKIIERLDNFNEQISDFHDHVAIGLSAQSIAHEIYPQLDNINLNTRVIKKKIKSMEIKDREIYRSLIAIEADNKIISQNVSLLNPMLRNQRTTRENLNVCSVINEYIKLRQFRFEKSEINVKVLETKEPLYIFYNRGKFNQIVDNLFRNSIYWLDHQSNYQEFEKKIHIKLEGRSMIFWDNGPGIREGVEDIVFDMFTSDKPKELGQGLGLYIISTLLKEVNSEIHLLNERNELGRKFKFLIDFDGAEVRE